MELADLNGDRAGEVIFAGGEQVQIYWNPRRPLLTGRPDDRTILPVSGNWTLLTQRGVRVAYAHVDGDGWDELLVVINKGVEIRSASTLFAKRSTLSEPGEAVC